MPLAPGEVFAGYTVLRELGVGGMGAVYLVRHPRLPRLDALKLLRPEFSADPDFAARFLREADLVAGLSHRNIVSVHDRGEDAGQLWLTMQYIEGTDAEAALADAGGLLPGERVARIVAGTAAALDCAHRHHLVHRDVKPANILLSASDDENEPEQVFLTDFGIAKSLDGGTRLTRTGAVLATFDYASPEQIESRPLDARSDVYSLGCVVHKLLTGRPPFPGVSVAAAIHGHLTSPPPRPTEIVPWLAPAVDDVVARAMAKDPADRFPTCRALAEATAQAVEDLPEPPGPPYRITLSGHGVTDGHVGPTTTDRIPQAATDRLVDLVRRTRFFDLPEDLHGVAGRSTTGHLPRGGRPVTVEIRSGTTAHRLVADLAEARRPPALDALVAAIGALPAAVPPEPARAEPARAEPTASNASAAPAAPAGPTVLFPRPAPEPRSLPGPRPSAPPRRRSRLPLVAALSVAVVAAAALVGIAVWRGDDPTGNGQVTPTTSPVAASSPEATPAGEAALASLPRSAPLPPETLVAALDVDDNADLYLVDAGTGTTTARITSDPAPDVGPLLSPDRTTVVYVRVLDGRNELRAVAADGSGDRTLLDAPLPACAVPMRPAWNPAVPSQLVVACHDEPAATTLLLVGLDGAVVRELAPGRPVVDDVTFAPDGDRIAYWGGDAGDGAGNLYTLAVDGSSGPQQVTDSGADNDVVWSPAGEQLAFARTVGDSREIHVVNSDGSQVRSLTSGGHADQGPSWSPDGLRITFKSNRPSSTGVPGDHLWVADMEGRGLPRELVVDGTVLSSPTWGPC